MARGGTMNQFWQRFLRNRSALIGLLVLLSVIAVAVFVPQLLAYRAINGSFGPSRLVTRKMMYTSPHFLEVRLETSVDVAVGALEARLPGGVQGRGRQG